MDLLLEKMTGCKFMPLVRLIFVGSNCGPYNRDALCNQGIWNTYDEFHLVQPLPGASTWPRCNAAVPPGRPRGPPQSRVGTRRRAGPWRRPCRRDGRAGRPKEDNITYLT